TGTGTGHGEDDLRCGSRGNGRSGAAGHVVDVIAVAAGAPQPCHQHRRRGAAGVENKTTGRLENDGARADVAAGVLRVTRAGQTGEGTARPVSRNGCATGGWSVLGRTDGDGRAAGGRLAAVRQIGGREGEVAR